MKYDFQTCAPEDLEVAALTACLSIITQGRAVRIQTAKRDLPQAHLVTVVRAGSDIVAVGAIKRSRPLYALDVAKKSGFKFDENLPELGYIARDAAHKGHKLSEQIIASLLFRFGSDQLFSTTSHPTIKEALRRAGFEKMGNEWEGDRKDMLSLWIRSK